MEVQRAQEGESMLKSVLKKPKHNSLNTVLRQRQEKADKRFSKRSRKCATKTVLTYLVYVFAITTVVLLGLFLIYFFKYQNKVIREVCDSPSCVIAASEVAVKMDASVDPCDDFAQYACGNFYKTATYSEGKTYHTPFSALDEANLKQIKALLSEEEKSDERTYVKNMKRLYRACRDEGTIEKIGVSPYLESSFAKEWPTLIGRNWSGESTFDLSAVNSAYMAVAIQPFFSIAVTVDIVNSSKHSLSLDDPTLVSSRKILRKPRDAPEVKAIEEFLTSFAVELGADPQVAAEDAAALVDLDSALAKVLVPAEERRNFSRQYNPTTLAGLGKRYTFIDIPGAFRSIFATVNLTLEDSQEVIVRYPDTLDSIQAVLNTTDKRTLQNSFGFKMALRRTDNLTKRLRDIHLDLEKILYGKTEEEPRSDKCANYAIGVFQFGVGKEFIRKNFPEDSKIYMNAMIDNLQSEFEDQLHSATWLGDTTRKEAFRKLALMSRMIGYPDKNFSEEDIDKKYENLTMRADSHYENLETVRSESIVRSLLKLKEETDKHEWSHGPHTVNAFYAFTQNSIFFPAGILQPPFFSPKFPDALNYGAIGVVIGHEITHGFDDRGPSDEALLLSTQRKYLSDVDSRNASQLENGRESQKQICSEGSQFDQDGNLRNWWQRQDQKNFQQARQCIVQQYSNFSDPKINMTVNGITTQGENVADNGGLKQSFRAFKKLMARQGEPKPLPGLKLTNDQTFFLGYAQLWCMKMTDKMKRLIMLKNSHPPGEFRILGPLQNSQEFADAYNCPLGSRMNPEKKCSVW